MSTSEAVAARRQFGLGRTLAWVGDNGIYFTFLALVIFNVVFTNNFATSCVTSLRTFSRERFSKICNLEHIFVNTHDVVVGINRCVCNVTVCKQLNIACSVSLININGVNEPSVCYFYVLRSPTRESGDFSFHIHRAINCIDLCTVIPNRLEAVIEHNFC